MNSQNFRLSHPCGSTKANNVNFVGTGGQIAIMNQTAQLKEYAKYLDDYEVCRAYRLQSNAIIKYHHIMQTIKTKYKDRYHVDDDEEDHNDEWCQLYNKIKQSDLPPFNKILKRHRARLAGMGSLQNANEQTQIPN